MKITLNTILLAIIAVAVTIISIFLGILIFCSRGLDAPQQWEYGRKEILGVDPEMDDFEAFNAWLKEGWEPIMKMDGERCYLMRRPKPTL